MEKEKTHLSIALPQKLKKIIALALMGTFTWINASSQAVLISIEDCYELARKNYPAIQKQDLIAKTTGYSIDNARKRFLPQISFSGQASYQSQTISFPKALSNLPGAAITPISKDQYKMIGDIDQLLYDGGGVNDQVALLKGNELIQQQNLEVNLYVIRQRINTFYFSILLIDRQLAQNRINRANLQGQLQKAEAALKNGVAFKSQVNELEAEIINVDMGATDLETNRASFLKMLSLFIGKEISASSQLSSPVLSDTSNSRINRPELKVFDLQKSIYDLQELQIKTALRPRVSAFAQGAYGRPTLNLLENKFGPWFITGLRFNWSLGSIYTLRNQKSIIDVNKQIVEIDRQTFLLYNSLEISQQTEQVIKYRKLIEQDRKLILLRQSVKKSAEAQLANGVISTYDYIMKSNAEDLAQQQLIYHEIQLMQAQYNLRFITGN